MAFVSNDTQQLSFEDSTFNLTARERKFLDQSWAKAFAERIFPAIREEDFSVLYSNKSSRPNTPVNVIVGALILKETLGVTDDELVQALMFDIRYQYALHTTSFPEQPLSDRTLSRFRARCFAYETETGIDLIHACVVGLAKELSEFMGIKPNMQRMDSLMISANIRNLSLLELFYTCVANLARKMQQRETEIPKEQLHYVEKDDMNRFIHHWKEVDAAEKILMVMRDAEILLERCGGSFDDTSEYQLLIRLLKEQTTLDPDTGRRLRKKKEKEEPSKFLLNPADPEATCREKAGSKHFGYVGNVAEWVGERGSLVMDYAYEQNVYSDSQFIKDYLRVQPMNTETATLVTDGAYGSEHNVAQAKEQGIRLLTTNFTGRKPDDIYAEFQFNEEGTILLQCINGKEPEECRYDPSRERSIAYYPHETCNNCPHKDRCRPRLLTTGFSKEVSWKSVNRAKQLRYMETDEFIEYSHFRNGVEAVQSLLRRKYRVDRIPTHGKKQTRLHFGFKIAALNFQKLLEYTNSLGKGTQNSKIA